MEIVSTGSRNDDPRKLREILVKAAALAHDHRLTSVVVGLAAPEGDLMFPELVDFIESALRVDDAIFRMTRERAVLFLADVDRQKAQAVVERLMREFAERAAAMSEPRVDVGLYEVSPKMSEVSAKSVLPAVFSGRTRPH